MTAELLNKLYNFVRQSPSVRRLSTPILASNVNEGRSPGVMLERDNAYFQLRLSEMFLKNGRELWREFMPMAIFVTEFVFGGKQQIVPFVVSNDILNSIKKSVEGENIEYRNTRIAGPIPYTGGDVSLFTGLYRTKINDLSVGFFGFIGGVAQAFDVSGLSRYLDIAAPLGAGLTNLLGMKDVEFRLGTRDELSENKSLMSGYWVYLNAEASSIPQHHLWVRNGQLFFGEGNDIVRFSHSDYCLVELECLSERGDYTTLPFHALWEQAKALIWSGEIEKAKVRFTQLAQQVAVSPDLTKKHRFALMQVYKANFETELESHRLLIVGMDTREGDRDRSGSGGFRISATESLLEQYDVLLKTSLPKPVSDAVFALSKNWSQISGLNHRKKETLLTDEMISRQLSDVQRVTKMVDPQPDKLAEAINLATFAVR